MHKVFVLLTVFALGGCSVPTPETTPEITESEREVTTVNESNQDTVETQTLTIGEQLFEVEIADTPAERQLGLMYRESMSENQGMLFVWEDEAPRSFWMKNTLIPLDMIWIDANQNIVDIKAAEPCEVEDCPSFEGQAPAMYVLELNQGVLEAEIGDSVEF